MHSQRCRSTLGSSSFFVLTAMLAVVLSGCTTADLIATKDREISDLEYEKGHLRDSLAQTVSDLRDVRSQLATAENGKTKIVEEAEGLRTRLRFANEQLELASGERRKLEMRAIDSEARSEMLDRTLKKVQSVASDSVGELAELRFRSASYSEELKKLREESRSLREDRAQLLDKVDGLQDEVTRSKIALRSFRAGQKGEKNALAEFEQAIAALQKENGDLRGERIVLNRRFDKLAEKEEQTRQVLAKTEKAMADADADGSGIVAVASLSSIYTEDPQGLLREVGSFVSARYQKVVLGEIEWDAFDQALAGTAGLLVLFLIWTFLRSWRIRRLRREVADLREELIELEEAEGQEEEEEEQRRPRHGGSARVTMPSMRRSGGFSAVISTAGTPRPEGLSVQPAQAVEDEPPELLVDTPLGGSVLPVAGAAASGADGSSSGSAAKRRVIGARTWNDDESPLDQDEDELASTQIIPSLSSSDLEREDLVSNSGAVANVSGPVGGASKSATGTDQDLLDELKDAINKKFDEIV